MKCFEKKQVSFKRKDKRLKQNEGANRHKRVHIHLRFILLRILQCREKQVLRLHLRFTDGSCSDPSSPKRADLRDAGLFVAKTSPQVSGSQVGAHGGHLAVSGGIFGCHCSEMRLAVLGIRGKCHRRHLVGRRQGCC